LYEDLVGKKFQAKGTISGVMKEDGKYTMMLKMDNGASILVFWEGERYEAFQEILQSGNRVRLVVDVLEGGLIHGLTASKLGRIVVSKSNIPKTYIEQNARYAPVDVKTLDAYERTVRYFNPKLSSANARKIASSILTYSKINNIDPRLVVSVIFVESNFEVDARSVKGAIGLGQLMPETARCMNVDPTKVEENIKGTTKYLRDCMEKWKNYPYMSVPLGLASYNAGPNAVARHGGIPPYSETQAYVNKVMKLYYKLCGK